MTAARRPEDAADATAARPPTARRNPTAQPRTARKEPDTAAAGGSAPRVRDDADSPRAGSDLPTATTAAAGTQRYDDLTADEIVALGSSLDADEIVAPAPSVDADALRAPHPHEDANRGRRTVLHAIERLQPWEASS